MKKKRTRIFDNLKIPLVSLILTMLAFNIALGEQLSLTDQLVTVKFGNETMDRSLNKLKKATNSIAFNYKLDDVQLIKVKEGTFVNQPLKKILEILLANTQLTYTEKYNSIVISRKKVTAAADRIIVKGTVSDSNGPLLGAVVRDKNTKTGTSTDNNGSYKLTVDKGDILVFSFLGYKSQEVVADHSPINVILQTDATGLSAIVVVGYGTQKKSDVTGAIESISSKDFNQGAIINPLDQIQGKVAGLVITQQGGDPNNQSANVSIRGQTSISGNQAPLFVVDGVATTNASQFQNLSPSDIESYDVLKDASATAIYGSRGANGVVIVTTKKGHAAKTTIDYNAYIGVSNQVKYWDLLNASEYLTAISSIKNVNVSTYNKGANTDWQRAINRTGLTHSNNLALSGGTKDFNYRASINYENQQGIIINNGKRQLGLRFNAEQKALDDKLDVTFNISNTTVYRDELPDFNTIQYYIFNAPPTYPIYNADGSYNSFTDYNLANPVEHLKQTYNVQTSYQTLANATANYNLFSNVKVGVTGILIHDNTLAHHFTPSFPNEGNVNSASQKSNNDNTYEANAHINYDKSFGKHTIAATGVYEYNDFFTESFNASGANYLVPDLLDNNLGAGDQSKDAIGSTKSEYKIISFLARVNYNYDNRFYATASVRRDGSDKFGANHQWGTFPSFDLAYRLKRDLLKHVDWVDDFKLRLGYGVVGNANGIGPYNAITLYSAQGRYYDASNTSYLYPNSYSYKQNANPDLKWEERQGKNIGVDFSLLNYRLTGDINYYNDKTVNMLYNYSVPTPPFFVNSILANVGDMSNKGLEIALTGRPIAGGVFNWTVNGQIAFVKTRVLNLSGTYDGYALNTDQIVSGNISGRGIAGIPVTYIKPGEPLNVYYLPHFTGVDANGNELFDGKTLAQNPNPQKYYINPNPKFNYGLTNSFSYNNWDLSFVLRGVYGQKNYNNVLLDYETITRLPSANTTKTALTNGIKDGLQNSDKWLESASFLRMDNAALGYTFKHIKGFKNFRVYVAGNNLFIITKYRGSDPEISGNFIDYNSYPKSRTFLLGTNISFK